MKGIRTLTARYHVEPDLRIAWTSPNWDRFARENGAPELAGGSVVGHSLWEFIQGSETRALYEKLLFRVRDTGAEVTVPFRCDSPDVRRFMQLRMSRPEDGHFEIVAELLREERRAPVDLLDSARSRAGQPLQICSFCKKVDSPSDGWLEVEEVQSELELGGDTPLPPLAQVVCPECKAAADGNEIG